MRSILLGALAGAGLAIAATCALDDRGEACAQVPQDRRGVSGGQVLALPGPADEKGQLITIVDPQLRVMGVYHIEQATGKIGLRSVRNVHWDLQMMHLNSESPLPQEIQALLQTR